MHALKDEKFKQNHGNKQHLFPHFFLISGWKLNPVVSAVYSPEFYAGRKTCPSPSVTISFAVIFLPLIRFVLGRLRHLHFLHPPPPSLPHSLFTLTFITSPFSLFLQTCNQAKSVYSTRGALLSHTNVNNSLSSQLKAERILVPPTPPTSQLQRWPSRFSPKPKSYPVQLPLFIINHGI